MILLRGKYEKADTVTAGEDSITVDGKEIKIYAFPDANNCPWGELKVDVVLECSDSTQAKRKLRLISMQVLVKLLFLLQQGNDLPTIVYNTNHETLKLLIQSSQQLLVQQTA